MLSSFLQVDIVLYEAVTEDTAHYYYSMSLVLHNVQYATCQYLTLRGTFF